MDASKPLLQTGAGAGPAGGVAAKYARNYERKTNLKRLPTSTRSTPSSDKGPQNEAISRAGHVGKASFQSWRIVTPGQTTSFGVPKILTIKIVGHYKRECMYTNSFNIQIYRKIR